MLLCSFKFLLDCGETCPSECLICPKVHQQYIVFIRIMNGGFLVFNCNRIVRFNDLRRGSCKEFTSSIFLEYILEKGCYWDPLLFVPSVDDFYILRFCICIYRLALKYIYCIKKRWKRVFPLFVSLLVMLRSLMY